MNLPSERAILRDLRTHYYSELFGRCIRCRDGVPNMADSSSLISSQIAKLMIDALASEIKEEKLSGQSVGAAFSEATARFLEDALDHLTHLRPGTWTVSTAQGAAGIAKFAQYTHITDLQGLIERHPEIKTALGGDYLITPDIVVFRDPLSDSEINTVAPLVSPNDSCARRTPVRKGNVEGDPATLHASISLKWSLRSDRAQNARTEALNLIRNRKGHTPRIVVVTFEPLPGRIASIAMGTGDIDCTYHAALDELLWATERVDQTGSQLEILKTLIEGRRLRDISDLPLDLVS